MPERGSFLYRISAVAIAAAEILIQATHPAQASECIPLQSIPMGRTIQVAGRYIDLPEGIRVRAVLFEYYPQEDYPEPCIRKPVYMLAGGDGIAPYILVRISDGKFINEQPEGEEDPFALLKEILTFPEN